MSQPRGNRYDADRLAVLDEELEFALRSLDDLEAEHAAGQISDEQHRRLHAEYTVRAADAVRQKRQEVARRPTPPPRSRRVWLAIVVAVFLSAAVVGTSLRQGAQARSAGQTITGNTTTTGTGRNDPRALDAQAETLLTNGDMLGALKDYLAAIRLDQRDVEALTYAGWISFLGGAPEKAQPLLDAAVRVDPNYPDAHAFRGIVLFKASHDRAGATTELRRYLQLVPRGQMSGQVRDVLSQVERS